jgi:hypothetical protein
VRTDEDKRNVCLVNRHFRYIMASISKRTLAIVVYCGNSDHGEHHESKPCKPRLNPSKDDLLNSSLLAYIRDVNYSGDEQDKQLLPKIAAERPGSDDLMEIISCLKMGRLRKLCSQVVIIPIRHIRKLLLMHLGIQKLAIRIEFGCFTKGGSILLGKNWHVPCLSNLSSLSVYVEQITDRAFDKFGRSRESEEYRKYDDHEILNNSDIAFDRAKCDGPDECERYLPLLSNSPNLRELHIVSKEFFEDEPHSIGAYIPEAIFSAPIHNLTNLSLHGIDCGARHSELVQRIGAEMLSKLSILDCDNVGQFFQNLAKLFQTAKGSRISQFAYRTGCLIETDARNCLESLESLIMSMTGLKILWLDLEELPPISAHCFSEQDSLEILYVNAGADGQERFSVEDVSYIMGKCPRLEQFAMNLPSLNFLPFPEDVHDFDLSRSTEDVEDSDDDLESGGITQQEARTRELADILVSLSLFNSRFIY